MAGFTPRSASPDRSFAQANKELAEAFERYLISRGFSPPTLRAYMDSVNLYVEALHSTIVVDVERRDIRQFQASLLERGLSQNSVRLHTIALRSFHKFISLAGLTKHDPTLLVSARRLPVRIPRFLTVEEVDRLIAACETPFERARIEVLYSTGVRLGELVKIRVDDIAFSGPGVIRITRGKGGKDRIVVFGSKADAAIRAYLGPQDGIPFRGTRADRRADKAPAERQVLEWALLCRWGAAVGAAREDAGYVRSGGSPEARTNPR